MMTGEHCEEESLKKSSRKQAENYRNEEEIKKKSREKQEDEEVHEEQKAVFGLSWM